MTALSKPDQPVDQFGFESHHEMVRSRLPTGTVTFLFTDIEDSTGLLQRLGDAYSGLLDRHAAIVRRALAGNKGFEVGVEGDAFFAVFTSAEEAMSAAVEAQRSLVEEPWPEDRRVRIRMGLHTGQGRLGGNGYVGLDVHRAARIASAAHGGQILLSAATKELVAAALPPSVGLRDLGVHRLRGIDQVEHIYQLVIDGLSVDFPPIRTIDARQTNIPPQRTSFVGRERDVAAVSELVRRARMVTLTGPGGIGKTRLSLKVAIDQLDHFEDGVYLSDLSPIHDASLVPDAIVTALLLPEQPGRAAIDVLIHHLRDRHLLLVLDNFEQVAEAAPIVGRLLDEAPRLSVLATSRMPLHLSGEQEFPMSPLPLPDREHVDLDELSSIDAVQLFVERVAAIRPGFRLTPENARAIAQITVRLDGLPLAIELAAGRTRLFSPEAILARLDARMDLLEGGPKDVPARQQTLRAAIEWSHDLLRAGEQRLFARLAAFSGGCTLDAAQAVCGPGLSMSVMDGLTLLVDHSLVRLAEDDIDETRFATLETIREYAAERLAASGERDEVRRRHADYFRALAEEARPEHVQPDAHSAHRLDRERDNVRAALAWALDAGQAEIGLHIAAAVWALYPRRDLAEGRIWLERLLAHPAAQPRNEIRARALASLAGIYLWQNQPKLGRAAAQEAIGIARELGSGNLLAYATGPLAVLLQAAGEFDLEEAALQEAMDSAEAAGHRLSALEIRARIGFLQVFRGNPVAAIAPLRELIAAQVAAGLASHAVWSVVSLGSAEMLSGDLQSATRHFREVIAMSNDTGDLVALGAGVAGLAFVASRQGRHEAMARLWGFVARLREEAGGGPAMSILRVLGDPVGDARRALGDQAFERIKANGEAMDIEEAVTYATMDTEVANV